MYARPCASVRQLSRLARQTLVRDIVRAHRLRTPSALSHAFTRPSNRIQHSPSTASLRPSLCLRPPALPSGAPDPGTSHCCPRSSPAHTAGAVALSHAFTRPSSRHDVRILTVDRFSPPAPVPPSASSPVRRDRPWHVALSTFALAGVDGARHV
jgi:hypothetical protein